MTLAEVLRTLRQPTPPEAVEWVLTVKGKERWMWSAYPDADWIRKLLLEKCPAGHSITIEERWVEIGGRGGVRESKDEKIIRIRLLIYDPEAPTRYVEFPGIGGGTDETHGKRDGEKVWKGALTQALKNAALSAGIGLDLHGVVRWTEANADPPPKARPTPAKTKAPPRKASGGKPPAQAKEDIPFTDPPAESKEPPQDKDLPTKGNGEVDWATAFWKTAKEREVSKETALKIKENCGGDFQAAFNYLIEYQ